MNAVIRWHDCSVDPAALSRLLDTGATHEIKQTPHRAVRRVVGGGLDVHVKRYADGPARWLRGPRARREFRLTREVARRGVPTLEALAWGHDSRGSYLVTRTLADAVELTDVLAGPLSPVRRRETAAALGIFLARAHRAGVRHDDLHPGNVLMRRGDPYLIDLHAVRLSGPLGWAEASDNLAVFDRWFSLRHGRADRLRFWKAYGREAGFADDRAVVADLARRSRDSVLRFVAGLDRRCLGGNRHYRRVRAGGASGHAAAGVDPVGLMRHADALIDAPATKTLKRSASSAVVEAIADVDGAAKGVVLKRVDATRWTDPLAALFRPPAALHAYVMGCALRLRGVPTPRPLAVWHRRAWGLPTDGYLLTEKLHDAVDLGRFVETAGPARVRSVAAQLGRLLARLHAWGYSHRDLKAPNVLVGATGHAMGPKGLVEAGEGGDHVWLVDLAGVRHRRPDDARRAQDLGRLAASFLARPGATNAARLRLLRAYLGYERGEWKAWWRRIAAAARAKAERNRREGRVLG